jgi:hypothetical protein
MTNEMDIATAATLHLLHSAVDRPFDHHFVSDRRPRLASPVGSTPRKVAPFWPLPGLNSTTCKTSSCRGSSGTQGSSCRRGESLRRRRLPLQGGVRPTVRLAEKDCCGKRTFCGGTYRLLCDCFRGVGRRGGLHLHGARRRWGRAVDGHRELGVR